MKKYLFLLVSVAVLSCTTEDDFIKNQEGVLSGSEVLAKNSNPVSLLKSWSSYSYYRGFSTYTRMFTVRVANIGTGKNVSIFHEKVDGNWEEIQLTYSTMLDDQSEIWEGTHRNTGYDGSQIYADEFVIKYDTDGVTYWDNNSGQNYKMGNHEGTLFGPADLNISVDADYSSLFSTYKGDQSQFNVVVDVKNIVPDKEVVVVYTTDHWETTQYLPLVFTQRWYNGYQYVLVSPNRFNIERWTGSVHLDSTVNRVEYAVVYKVNGKEYWDNNYGRNHRVYK